MSKVLGIIPARAGSKRVPGKNMRQLNGEPLISYALDAALNSKKLTAIAVSSDDESILNYARLYNSKILCIQRPESLSTDQSTALEYTQHALEFLEKHNSLNFDLVVIIQVTSPFTISDDIDSVIECLEASKADCAASVRRVPHDLHPIKFKRIEHGLLVPLVETENGRMAAHQLDPVYVRNGAVYASKIELIQKNQLLNENCAAFIMPDERSLDINTEMDLQFAQFLMQAL
ncbi:MAG: acylneuraminate cytidylyltransferase family protein [Saprospiraceae bacterium]